MTSKRMVAFALLLLIIVFGCGASDNYSLNPAIAAPSFDTMGTGFAYQGYIEKDFTPANGTFDFEFRLYDAVAAGGQIGSLILKSGVAVSGVFIHCCSSLRKCV